MEERRGRGHDRRQSEGGGRSHGRGRGHDRRQSEGGGRSHGRGRGSSQNQERGLGRDRSCYGERRRGQFYCREQERGRGHGRDHCGDHEPSRPLWEKNVKDPSGLGKGYCEEGFQEHQTNATNALQELEEILGTKGKDLTAFNEWCAHHADQQFPGLRQKAYAIPPFFFKCYPVKMTTCGCAQVKPCPGKFFMIIAQESDQKGDNAQRKVGRAFRLLNEDLERKGEPTLFIMTGVVRDNILAWVKRPQNSSELVSQIEKLFPIVPADRPDGAPVCEKKQRRMETDLMVVHQKGVTFVQVKGCGANKESQDSAVINREVAAAVGQLAKDEAMFKQLMQGSNFRDKCQVQKVVAVPALTRQQLTKFNVKSEQDVVFLCQDDLFLDEIETAESETDLTHFRQWWSQLIAQAAEVPPNCSAEIIGKYAGLLSTPVSQKYGGFHHLVRSLKDAIRLTARAYQRQMLTTKDTEWVDEERKEKLVCLAGHEICGVRQLLYKARHFTHIHESGCVVVVYQSDQRILTALRHALKDKMMGVTVQSGNYIENIRKRANNKKLLFIVGEVCAGDSWMTVLRTLHKEFKDCSVWFMADPQQLPEDLKKSPVFCEQRLDVVLCCPPAVQHLLHHVRGSEGVSQPHYIRDTCHMEVPTNGPIPLCIRHGQHGGRIADCGRCAQHVSQFLIQNVRGCRPPRPKKRTQPATYADAVKTCKGQGPSSSTCFDLSVAILFQCPQENQAGTDQHIDHVTRAAPFLQCLEGLIEVKNTRLSREMKEIEAGGVWVGCTDSLFKYTIDVAIFVPHEAADTQPEHQGQVREYRKSEGQTGQNLASSRPEGSTEPRSLPPIPSLYWTRSDLERYNPYNKAGIMELGHRCLSQLILIVP